MRVLTALHRWSVEETVATFTSRADPEAWTLKGKNESSSTTPIGLHVKHGFDEHGRLPAVGYKFGRRLDLVYMGLGV